MNWKHWVTTQEPWHYSSSCCLSIQPFLQKNYPPPHFRIRFVKLVTDLFILLAFAAFFYLFSFFVIFFRFLLCFVVFLIWWCFLKLHSFWPLRTTVTFAIFCLVPWLVYFALGLCVQSQERLRNPSRREVPRHKVFLLLMIHQDKFNSVRKRRRKKCQLRDI